jgi:hypothetical protein
LSKDERVCVSESERVAVGPRERGEKMLGKLSVVEVYL